MPFYTNAVISTLVSKPFAHIPRTALAAAVPASPTRAEIQAYATANTLTSVQAYYTGDDVANPANATRLYAIDKDGVVIVGEDASTSASDYNDTLTIIARNSVNPLAFTPLSPVDFFVNGVKTKGITNVGVVVTINPSVVGFNIDPGTDEVTADYAR